MYFCQSQNSEHRYTWCVSSLSILQKLLFSQQCQCQWAVLMCEMDGVSLSASLEAQWLTRAKHCVPHLCCVHAPYTAHRVCKWDACVWRVLCVTVIPDSVWHPSIWPCCCLSERSSVFVSAWGVGALCVWVELGSGLKDNWRSLFRQPLVDPCRSGGRVTDQSKHVCGSLGLFQCIQAGVTDEMVCNKLGVMPHIHL